MKNFNEEIPLSGFHYLIEGFKLIFQPGIKRYIIIPILTNAILFVSLFFLAKHFFADLEQWLIPYLPTWLKWLSTVLWILFFITYLLIFAYTFVTFTNIISAPFNNLLAEKVEFFLSGKALQQKSWLESVKEVPRVIGRQFSILGYYLPRAFILLICFFIPILQIFAALFWFLFNAWFVSLQYLDYPTENHQVPIKAVREVLNQNRFLSLSFGISILMISMVPFLNFILAPAAVAGATKLWLRLESTKS